MDWTLDSSGILTISGEGDMEGFSSYSSDAWRKYSDSIKKVVITDGVTSIGEGAFEYCFALESTTIGANVASIDWYAFRGCKALETITVSEGNKVYHSKDNCIIETETNTLIAGCKNSTIPPYVTAIGRSAFEGCATLTEITIPVSVTFIDRWAFSSCIALTEITIPDSVTYIGGYAFEGCKSLTEINIPGSVTSIYGGAFEYCSALKSVTIGSGVTSIYDSAFYNCTALTEITIPDSVTSIRFDAFNGCSALTGITIPNSVTSIDYHAFFDCSALKLVFVKSPDIAAGLESSDSNGHLIRYAETVILGPKCTATDYIKENFPYTGTATIGGETCTWYRKTEECTVHYYENPFDADCNICGEKRKISAVFGDINGDGVVDNADAALVLRYDAGLAKLKDVQYTAADVNGDEIVDNADAALILRLDAGLINGF